MVNSVDTDQTALQEQSDLGLHCLLGNSSFLSILFCQTLHTPVFEGLPK